MSVNFGMRLLQYVSYRFTDILNLPKMQSRQEAEDVYS